MIGAAGQWPSRSRWIDAEETGLGRRRHSDVHSHRTDPGGRHAAASGHLQVATGQELDEAGEMHALDLATWKEKYQQLQQLGGLFRCRLGPLLGRQRQGLAMLSVGVGVRLVPVRLASLRQENERSGVSCL